MRLSLHFMRVGILLRSFETHCSATHLLLWVIEKVCNQAAVVGCLLNIFGRSLNFLQVMALNDDVKQCKIKCGDFCG